MVGRKTNSGRPVLSSSSRLSAKQRLFQAILSWKAEWVSEAVYGSMTPGILKTECGAEDSEESALEPPPSPDDTFPYPAAYVNVHLPLLICDVFASVRSEYGSPGGGDPAIQSARRLLTPHVFDLAQLSSKERKVREFKAESGASDPYLVIKLATTVLLAQPEDSDNIRFFLTAALLRLDVLTKRMDNAPVHKSILAIVDSITMKQTDASCKIYQLVIQITVSMSTMLVIGSGPRYARMTRISGLTAYTRIASGLDSFPTSPLESALLDPGRHLRRFLASPPQHSNGILPPDVTSVIGSQFNQSQLSAMLAIAEQVAAGTPAVSLVHGPPGTGKSRTVLGLLQLILRTTPPGSIVLLTAPSNGAVDELVRKYHHSAFRNKYEPDMIRVGRKDCVSPDLLHYAVSWERTTKLKNLVREMEREIRQRQGDGDPQETKKMEAAYNRLSDALDANLLVERAKYPEQRKAGWNAVLSTVRVVATTLNSAGHSSLDALVDKVAAVVVDEACQGTELEALIPLRFRCPSFILVGDPRQLPPTVVSDIADRAGLSRSLFERLERCLEQVSEEDKLRVAQEGMRGPIHFLDTQYRMHPAIAAWPSAVVYRSRLKDDQSLHQRDRRLPEPYFAFNLTCGEDVAENGMSYANTAEVEFVTQLVHRLRSIFKPSDIGIITFYRAQVDRLKRRLSGVEVGTVDGFQGREKPLIILSCVRTNGTGFLSDIRRLNVALTRAQHGLLLVGSLTNLADRNAAWHSLINDAVERDLIVNVEGIASSILDRVTAHLWQPLETQSAEVVSHEPAQSSLKPTYQLQHKPLVQLKPQPQPVLTSPTSPLLQPVSSTPITSPTTFQEDVVIVQEVPVEAKISEDLLDLVERWETGSDGDRGSGLIINNDPGPELEDEEPETPVEVEELSLPMPELSVRSAEEVSVPAVVEVSVPTVVEVSVPTVVEVSMGPRAETMARLRTGLLPGDPVPPRLIGLGRGSFSLTLSYAH